MALLSMCLPILPGKKETWLQMMNTINEASAKVEMDKSRENAGVHERTFLQETPNGDFVILTFEGENPAESLGKIWHLPLKNLPHLRWTCTGWT